MSPENFCFWLQGFVELHKGLPNGYQWASIIEHLGLVFDKQTKPIPSPSVIESPMGVPTKEEIDWSKYLPFKGLPKEGDTGFVPEWYRHYTIPTYNPERTFDHPRDYTITC